MRSLLIPASIFLFGTSGCIIHDRPYRTVEYREQGYYYSGAHPLPSSAGWCTDEAHHVHEYAPDYAYYTQQDNYYVYSGPTTVWYYGYHPVPSGGHCQLHGRHSHQYHPGHHYSDAYSYDRHQQVYVYDAHRATAATPPPGQPTGYAPPGHGAGHHNNRPPPPGQAYTPPGGHAHNNSPPPGQGHAGRPHAVGSSPGHTLNPGHGGTPPGHAGRPHAGGSSPGHTLNPGHGGTPPGQAGRPHAVGSSPGHTLNPGRGQGHGGTPGGYGRPSHQGQGNGTHIVPGSSQTVPAGGSHSNNVQRPPVGTPPAGQLGRDPQAVRPGQSGGGHQQQHGRPQYNGSNNQIGIRPSSDRPNELPHKVDLPPPPERVNIPAGPQPPSSGPVEKRKKQDDRASQSRPTPANAPAKPAGIGRPRGPQIPGGGRR